MPRCAGSKPDGSPCERIVGASKEYCFSHDPKRADERRRNASKAGRSKPSREIAEIKALLADLTDGVLSARINTGAAAVANQLLNTRLRAVELERKNKETEELESRVAAVEAAAERAESLERQRAWRA